MKDYMFAPGRTPYDRGVRRLFQSRADTEVLTRGPHPSVAGRTVPLAHVGSYISLLNDGPAIDRPLHKIFIGTHGNDSGWMQIRFGIIDGDDDGRPDPNTTYEVLVKANDPILSMIYHLKPPSIGADTHFHIRGCMIGQIHALPFLNKLKQAFGNTVSVAAPRHFHAWQPFPNAGYMEFFCYQFQVARPTRFTGNSARADLIQAFKDENFQHIGTIGAVDDAWWEQWVPRNITRNGVIRSRVNLDPAIQPRRGNPINRYVFRMARSFRSVVDRFRYTVPDVTSNPGNLAARVQAVRDEMLADDKMKASHDFPYYQRLEFDSFTEFFDGFIWNVRYHARRKQLIATGTRRLYTCIIPVTSDPDPADNTKNHLIFNFNPDNNNTNPAISLINETDPGLFSIV